MRHVSRRLKVNFPSGSFRAFYSGLEVTQWFPSSEHQHLHTAVLIGIIVHIISNMNLVYRQLDLFCGCSVLVWCSSLVGLVINGSLLEVKTAFNRFSDGAKRHRWC